MRPKSVELTGRPAKGAPRRFLLVSRVGSDQRCVQQWLRKRDRNFDVLLSHFATTPAGDEGTGVYREFRPGAKIAAYRELLHERRDLWERYDYIALWDDDLACDTRTIEGIFAAAAAHQLQICQPSLSHDSHFSHAELLHQPGWKIRFTNFVEMMCPVFSRDALQRSLPLYSIGYELGIDLVWCNEDTGDTRSFAVLDRYQVRHLRPVASQSATNGFADGWSYGDEISTFLKRCRLRWISSGTFAAISANDKLVTSRLRLFVGALRIWPAMVRNRTHLYLRGRCILLHWSNLLFRRPQLQQSLPPLVPANHRLSVCPTAELTTA